MVKHKQFFFGATITSLLIWVPLVSVAHGNERGEASVGIGDAKVSINYGRPMLKGRDPMKMIEPGKVWRIGADAPTTLESNRELNFGGTIVPKGKHILLARLIQPGKWSLVISTKSVFQYEPSAKIAEVPLALQEAQTPVEMLEIKLSENGGHGSMEISWGRMRLLASFTAVK